MLLTLRLFTVSHLVALLFHPTSYTITMGPSSPTGLTGHLPTLDIPMLREGGDLSIHDWVRHTQTWFILHEIPEEKKLKTIYGHIDPALTTRFSHWCAARPEEDHLKWHSFEAFVRTEYAGISTEMDAARKINHLQLKDGDITALNTSLAHLVQEAKLPWDNPLLLTTYQEKLPPDIQAELLYRKPANLHDAMRIAADRI